MHGGPRINRAWLAIPYGESGKRLETNFATVSFLVQASPRICTNVRVDKVWRMHISNLFAIFTSKVSKRRIQCVKSWLMELIYLINQAADSKSWLFQAHPIIGNTGIQFCAICFFKDFSEETMQLVQDVKDINVVNISRRARDAAGRSRREEE